MPDVRFETFGLNAEMRSPPVPMERIHHHHEVELNFVFSGSVSYLHRGRVFRLPAGRLAVFWGSTPHSLVAVEPGSEMAWVTVPLTWLWGWNLPARFLRGLLRGDWWLAPEGMHERFPVRDWAKELSRSRDRAPRGLLLELEACLLWLSERAIPEKSGGGRTATDPTDGLRHVECMARCIAERFQENLTIAEVAKSAGLHPNYAMALFHRRCGVTIRDYMLQHRLTRAQQLLLTTNEKILDVALASGFGSQSAFYEAFTRAVKSTPAEFRLRMRA
jgi:AraC-like DNA-binding protein